MFIKTIEGELLNTDYIKKIYRDGVHIIVEFDNNLKERVKSYENSTEAENAFRRLTEAIKAVEL